MKKLLLSLLFFFSFNLGANQGEELDDSGLFLSNYRCDETPYASVFKGHLKNQSNKRITGIIYFDFYGVNKKHLGTCQKYINLDAKKENDEFRADGTDGRCYCKNATWKVRFKTLN
tara:strand:- start:235 stop:582 length:348 start_codon:yes stop_codon:yes gene_type:complete